MYIYFFFNDTATTEIYTLSLHDALPISLGKYLEVRAKGRASAAIRKLLELAPQVARVERGGRSEEHTSELQSQSNLVCRLLLEKKKKNQKKNTRQKSNLSHKTHRQQADK